MENDEIVVWIKAHKKALIIAGVSIEALIAVTWNLKNRDFLYALWGKLKTAVNANTTQHQDLIVEAADRVVEDPVGSLYETQIEKTEEKSAICWYVSEHIRNLHPGWNASEDKKAEAEKLGIILCPGQTIVDAYTKGNVAA